MSIFRRGEPLGGAPRRYKIRITTTDGRTLYWHKRGQVHVVDEDVADIFVANFKPELFQVNPDGTLSPPRPGVTTPIARVDKEPGDRPHLEV